jgi:hypothetical protein
LSDPYTLLNQDDFKGTAQRDEISSAFEKADRQKWRLSIGSDECSVHSRVGKLFPNSQQLYEMEL